jgi:hypothetical protein
MCFMTFQLTGKLTVDPPSAAAGERATKLRSQQEVRSYPESVLRVVDKSLSL